MNKLTYWLRKSGMLRTSSYTVKGDADKLNEKVADDGGMLQSQKEIDEQYEKSQSKINNPTPQNSDQNKKGSSSKVLFWIFLVVGIILCGMMLMMGFSGWFIVGAVLWGWFLRSVWVKSTMGMLIIWKAIVIGIVLVVTSFFLIDASLPSSEEVREEHDKIMAQFENGKQQQEDKNKSAEKEVVKADKISQFFTDLKNDTKIEFDGILNDANAVWTNGGSGLGLQDAKQITIKNTSDKTWKSIQKYFESNGGTHGTIGMVFVGNDNQTGYYFTDGEYKMLMCVMTQKKSEIVMSCGWGPGGGK